MACLIAFYSLTGRTRRMATHAARILGADLAEIKAPTYDRGFWRYVRVGLDSLRGLIPEIEVHGASPENYDMVVVMAPLWVGRAATPIRAYLKSQSSGLKSVAFILTCTRGDVGIAFDQLGALTPATILGSLVLTEKETEPGVEAPPTLTDFLSSLRRYTEAA